MSDIHRIETVKTLDRNEIVLTPSLRIDEAQTELLAADERRSRGHRYDSTCTCKPRRHEDARVTESRNDDSGKVHRTIVSKTVSKTRSLTNEDPHPTECSAAHPYAVGTHFPFESTGQPPPCSTT